MGGISTSVSTQTLTSLLPIVIDKTEYSIRWSKFEQGATPKQLLAFSDEVLNIFQDMRNALRDSDGLNLDQAFCKKQLIKLAQWGGRAYSTFFQENAQHILASNFQMMGTEIPAPTFISATIPFPWEALYEGEDYRSGDPEMFWGFRYSPARILIPENDISQFEHELSLPSDMLFCLHHQLHQAHRNEWPQIEQLVISQGQFRLLGPVCKLANPVCGESLLEYLYSADHNMVHFACHCRQQNAGEDELLVSLINEQNIEDNPKIIELGTYTFVDIKGHFHRKPLVFLNACQSAGGSDELRSTFNLPRAFIKRSAAAVVATACPVPDKFAAAFARQFYKYFMHGKEIEDPKTRKKTQKFASIGEALLETRQYFLKTHNNPLGLAYGLYSPAHYRLARPPFEGGTA